MRRGENMGDVRSCAARHRQVLSFCRKRAASQTPSYVGTFWPAALQRRSSERPCTSELRENARGVCIARWYDPATAEFTSIDPDAVETGTPYAYAGDEPVNQGDPSGLRAVNLGPWKIGCVGFCNPPACRSTGGNSCRVDERGGMILTWDEYK